jgi:hypothetical protein
MNDKVILLLSKIGFIPDGGFDTVNKFVNYKISFENNCRVEDAVSTCLEEKFL